MSDKPNFLWICTDQQRHDTLGCYGNPFVHSPNIDALAKTGALFENAFCQSPVCTPSRASFITGRYPRTTRCRQNGQSIPLDEVLVTRVLADAGYLCGLAGKFHLNPCHRSVAPIREKRINDGYTFFHWSHDHHNPKPINVWPGDEYQAWLNAHNIKYISTPLPECKHVRRSMPAEHHHTTWCANKAIEFMQNAAAHDTPWLFSVNIFDPHHAFDPPDDFFNRYLKILDQVPLPNYLEGELKNKPWFQDADHLGHDGMDFTAMSPAQHRLVRAAYWAMCDLIDIQVGRMIEALRQTGQLDNTIIIFMSDHGEMLGDHGIYLKGPHFYEPAIHIPLIISNPPRFAPDRRTSALTELTDLAPTILELAGLPIHPGMQGRSLLPLLTEKTTAHRDSVYCEYLNAMPKHEPKAFATCLRTATHKLNAFHGMEPGELYDLEKDPTETHNLWSDPASLPLKARLLECLCTRMAETTDPLPHTPIQLVNPPSAP